MKLQNTSLQVPQHSKISMYRQVGHFFFLMRASRIYNKSTNVARKRTTSMQQL